LFASSSRPPSGDAGCDATDRGDHPDQQRFRGAWGDTTRKAGIVDRTFHDLRGSAATRMSEAHCTPQEIAAITGHSLRDVDRILDAYLARTSKLGRNAIRELERGGVE